MIILISPAKTLDFNKYQGSNYTIPEFTHETSELSKLCKKLTKPDLKNLMGISDDLAELNYNRFQQFAPDKYNSDNAKPAIFAFKGDVYNNIDIKSFTQGQLDFLQKHLRIISGFYGILKPLDLMQPYRLEMGTKLQNGYGEDLYDFWQEKLTNYLNNIAYEQDYIINLASAEYFKAIKASKLKAKLINVSFKQKVGDNYKIVGILAKRARGQMVDYIVKNNVTTPEKLINFKELGYHYMEELSSEKEIIFVK